MREAQNRAHLVSETQIVGKLGRSDTSDSEYVLLGGTVRSIR